MHVARRRGSEAGLGTVLALGLMLVLLVLAAAAAPLTAVGLRKSATLTAREQALYLADAGLAAAVPWFELNYAPADATLYFDDSASPVTYNGAAATLPGNHPDPYLDTAGASHAGVPDAFAAALTAQPLGAGTYDVSATLLALGPELWRVRSIGTVRQHSTRVAALLERVDQVLFEDALFGEAGVTLNGNTVTDSYDSTAGPYGGDNLLLGEADVGSNKDIDLVGNAVINGDAHPGPGHSVNLGPGAVVTGSTEPSSSARLLAEVPVPSGAVSLGDVTLSGNDVQTLTSGVYEVGQIRITGNATLAIDSNGGGITLFVRGAVDVAGNGILNLQQDPRGLFLFATGSEAVQIGGNGDFYGAVYAPGADLTVAGNGDLYGSFVGRTISLDGNGAVHYDRSLVDQTVPGSFRMVSWWRELQ